MNFNIISPKTKGELLDAISKNKNNNYCFGAGYTDLINQFKSQNTKGLLVINIAQLEDNDFKGIKRKGDYVEIGALTTASDLIASKIIEEQYPVLFQATNSVASTQIRNSATIGGNVCNASPSADMSAALVALKAVCCILSSDGNEREEDIESFIQGVRKTSLKKDEILRAIKIPNNISKLIYSGFEKVGTRKSMEISIVSFSYHFQMDDNKIINQAGISIGAVSTNIPFASKACDFIKGKKLDQFNDKQKFADLVLSYSNPISDIRATKWYRKEVLSNISKSIFI